jgi:hypothetical protein
MPNQPTQRSTPCPDVRLNRYNSSTRNTDRLRAGHVPPKSAVTFDRNHRSHSAEIGGHVRRNTQSLVGFDLADYSLDTVNMFYKDAVSAGFRL